MQNYNQLGIIIFVIAKVNKLIAFKLTVKIYNYASILCYANII